MLAMPIYHFFFLLLVLALTFLFTLSSADQNCHPDDVYGLLAFKSGFTDPSGVLSTWTPDTDCCSWYWIECQSDYRVSSLAIYIPPDQPNGYLTGTISPSLANVSFLGGIFLTNFRNLSGPFPDVLFHLPNLEYVFIENGNLSGPLPHNIGDLTGLRSLGFDGNRFSGKIPASISKLTNLTVLELSNNLLTGHIPDGLRQLKYINILTLDSNQLSGPIPDIFNTSSSPRLQTLTLSHNKLTGPIPASISTLAPVLENLQLDHNHLTGQIPIFLGNFTSLFYLDLSWNHFTGSVPKGFENIRTYSLDLSHNHLVNPFPALYMKGINLLDLSYNSFHFEQIPDWITSLPIINTLRLAKCGINIKLDDWKPEVTRNYQYIDLSHNEISGSPVGLLNTTVNVVSFKASNNRLKFDLEDLEKLTIMTFLDELDLGKNQVFGKVTEALIGVKNLNVSYNKLCGSLPPNKLPVSTFVGNRCLCGSPLTTPCCSKCH